MSFTKEQRIINQVSGSTKQDRKGLSSISPTGGTSFNIPNKSGDHRRSIKRDAPVGDHDLVNKEYVDSLIPVTHASTTGQTTDDHHPQSHSHASHTGIGTDDHHVEFTATEHTAIADAAPHHGVNDANSTSEPLKGADDNYVTDAEKIVIGNTSGTNTGDQNSHDALDNVSADDHHVEFVAATHTAIGDAAPHHAESHTVASHSDTTGTGAELDTLTDNSMADTLHRHSELSASDGTPDASVTVGTDGAMDVLCASNIGLTIGSTDAGSKIGVYDNSTSNVYSVALGAEGNDLTLHSGTSGTERMRIYGTAGHVSPNSAGSQNFGDATDYWGDVSYKTLTDRGCLGCFTDNLALINNIKTHATKETIYGKPMLDYKTMPTEVYKPADKDGVLLERDEDDEPFMMEDEKDDKGKKTGKKIKKMAADGAETTALISIMIGAIKELSTEIEKIKADRKV